MAFNVNKTRTPKTGLFPAMMMVGIFALFGLSCLGGGGDDDGGPPPPSSLSYTGTTDQAPINESNAQELAGRALAGGRLGSGFGNIASSQNDDVSVGGEYSAYRTYRLMESAMFQIDLPRGYRNFSPSVSESDVIPGDLCGNAGGGSASYTIDLDIASGIFSGTLSFNNFCDDNIELLGSVSFSGRADITNPSDPTIDEFSLSFGVLTIADYTLDEEGFIQGTFTYDGSKSPVVITMNLLIQDSDGLIYRLSDYRWEVTEDTVSVVETETIVMSGTFYHPNFGYVEITTPIAFVYIGGWYYPSSGSVTFTGAGGTAVQLIALNIDQCQINVETDGDGLFDDFSVTIFWDDLII